MDRWLYLLFSEVDFARLKRLPKDSFLFLDQNRKQQYFIALKIMQMRHPRWCYERMNETLQFPKPMKSNLAALTRTLNSTPQYYTSLIPTRKLSCRVPPYTGRSDRRVTAQNDRGDSVSCSRKLLQHRCFFSIGPLVVFWFVLPQQLVLKYYLHAFCSNMLKQRNYLYGKNSNMFKEAAKAAVEDWTSNSWHGVNVEGEVHIGLY